MGLGKWAGCDVERVLAALATRQGGAVGRKVSWTALGVGRGWTAWRLKRGRMHTVYRGVYALGHEALTPLGRLVAALLAAGPGATLSHRTAAALWKLISSMPPFVEITLTDRRPRHRPNLVIHHKPHIDTTTRYGLPVTTPLATILDLPPKEQRKAANEALVHKLLTRAQELEQPASQEPPPPAQRWKTSTCR